MIFVANGGTLSKLELRVLYVGYVFTGPTLGEFIRFQYTSNFMCRWCGGGP